MHLYFLLTVLSFFQLNLCLGLPILYLYSPTVLLSFSQLAVFIWFKILKVKHHWTALFVFWFFANQASFDTSYFSLAPRKHSFVSLIFSLVNLMTFYCQMLNQFHIIVKQQIGRSRYQISARSCDLDSLAGYFFKYYPLSFPSPGRVVYNRHRPMISKCCSVFLPGPRNIQQVYLCFCPGPQTILDMAIPPFFSPFLILFQYVCKHTSLNVLIWENLHPNDLYTWFVLKQFCALWSWKLSSHIVQRTPSSGNNFHSIYSTFSKWNWLS